MQGREMGNPRINQSKTLRFALSGNTCAVDYEVAASTQVRWKKIDVEMSATAREHGVVGRSEVEAHHLEYRPQEALGLAQRQVEDNS